MIAFGLASLFFIAMILNIGYLYSTKQYEHEKLAGCDSVTLKRSKWWIRVFKGGRNTLLALFVVILADHLFK
ncbi:hypothetical protein [Pseudomonas phage PA1C]|nr:hypothetical protein [Pseudomonas phage PA1C]